MSETPLARTFDLSFVVAYLVAGLSVFAISATLPRAAFGLRSGEAAVAGAASVLSVSALLILLAPTAT